MTTNLRLTDAGRAAIVDPNNVGTQAVQITQLALGAGSGMGGEDDDGLAALRDQRDIEAVAGSNAVAGQIALRAEFDTPTAYAVTEMGLFARIGDGGAEFLFAYWTDDGTVFINKPADLRTIVAATVTILRSEADVTVVVSPNLTVSAIATLLDLTDGPSSYVNAALFKLAVTAAGNGFQFVSGLLPHEVTAVNALIAAAVDDVRDSAPGALNTLFKLAAALGNDPDFSATVMGLIAARLTQDQVDARIEVRAHDVELASGIDLTAHTTATQALAQSMDDFRWLVVIAGASASDFDRHLRILRARVTALNESAELLAWTIDNTDDTAQLYLVDPSDGSLTARGAAQALPARMWVAGDIAWTGTELLAWAINNTDDTAQLYLVDPSDGSLTARGAARALGVGDWNGVGLAWTGTELLGWAIEDGTEIARLYAVDPSDGSLTARGQHDLGANLHLNAGGLAWTGTELLAWAIDNASGTAQLYLVDPSDGSLTARGAARALPARVWVAGDIAWTGTELLAWAIDNTDDTAQLYFVDPSDGSLTARGAAQALGSGAFLAFGAAQTTQISGGARAGGFRLGRQAAQSLHLRSGEDLHVHQILGIR